MRRPGWSPISTISLASQILTSCEFVFKIRFDRTWAAATRRSWHTTSEPSSITVGGTADVFSYFWESLPPREKPTDLMLTQIRCQWNSAIFLRTIRIEFAQLRDTSSRRSVRPYVHLTTADIGSFELRDVNAREFFLLRPGCAISRTSSRPSIALLPYKYCPRRRWRCLRPLRRL
jgi:hypothetical protein